LTKKQKDQETYYPTDSQLQLLDVCGYKGYIVPLAFRSSMEANQFVDSYVLKKTKFLEQHNKMLAPGIHFFKFCFHIDSHFSLILVILGNVKLLMDTLHIPHPACRH
jgi:hypothetical protein